MGQVPTKKVTIKATGNEATINASDFRADLHEEVKGDEQRDLTAKVRSARSVEEIDRVAAEIDAHETEGGTKKRSASKEGDALKAELLARREVLLMEKGPKFMPDAPPPQYVEPKHVQYVPYMAPPSPGIALRTNGVDPVEQARMAAPLQTENRSLDAVGAAVADDTRNPKGKGTDVSALAGKAENTGANTLLGTAGIVGGASGVVAGASDDKSAGGARSAQSAADNAENARIASEAGSDGGSKKKGGRKPSAGAAKRKK
jgi:hypothetical protein